MMSVYFKTTHSHSHSPPSLLSFVLSSLPSSLRQNVELPDSFTAELKDLLEGLLQRDVSKRLGCQGRGYDTHTHTHTHRVIKVHINLCPISVFMSCGALMNSSVRCILLAVLISAGNTGWCSLWPSEDR